MNTEQYNECLRQANLAIKRLQSNIERLEKENANLTDDLLETQEQCRQAENKFEDVELFFCDEDGCPIIEPLNSDGLVSWLQAHNLEQHIKSINNAVETCEKHHADNLGEEVITVIDLLGYKLGLEHQAKALEESK
jgi:hypothetical protein